jgi:hypothetical protein
LKCFTPGYLNFLAAIKQLLDEDLIRTVSAKNEKASREQIGIRINPALIERIIGEIRPWYKDPV